MTSPDVRTSWFSGDLRPALRSARFGRDRLVPRQDEAGAEVVLYDTFDGQVAAADRLLVARDKELLLLGGPGSPAPQEAAAPGFVADMESGAVQAELARLVSPLRRLIRIGDVQLTLQPMALLDDLDKTLVHCDVLVLIAGAERAVSLVQMQALRGYDKALGRLAEGLDAAEGVTPLAVSSAAAALLPNGAGYAAKPALQMSPDMSAFAAANEIIRAHLPAARQNEAGAIADIDSEFLHDYRVLLRKVRSVLSLLKGVYAPDVTEDLKARFGALMARTGRLRDLDVYLIERDAYLALVPAPLRPGLEMLFDEFAKERAEEQKALAKHLGSDAYQREMRKLGKLFDKPKKALEKGPEADRKAHDLAQSLIWKRYRKVCTIAASINESTPDAQVHELRIHCKKLRYLMEFFAPFFEGNDINRLIKALKKLQDTLGTFNDCAVQQEALARKLDELSESSGNRKLEIAKSLGALLTVLDRRQQEAREQVVASFAAFNAPAVRDGFRQLFKTRRTTA